MAPASDMDTSDKSFFPSFFYTYRYSYCVAAVVSIKHDTVYDETCTTACLYIQTFRYKCNRN